MTPLQQQQPGCPDFMDTWMDALAHDPPTLKNDTANRPNVTIVIPSYRSERTLAAVLERLTRELPAAVREVLVVESGGRPAVTDICHRFAAVRVMNSSRRLSPGAARNTGARATESDFILFLDADCMPAPGWGIWLAELLGAGHPVMSAAIDNGTPHSWAGSVQFWLEFMDFSPCNAAGRRPFISTYCLLCRRDVYEATAGFQEDYFMGEDIIFSYQLGRLGYPLFFSNRWQVRHLNRTRFGEVFPHLYRLGWWSSLVRSGYPEVRGSFLRHSPFLIPILIPFRYARLCRRLFTSSRLTRCAKMVVALLAWPSLTVWCAGFMKGMIRSLLANKRRPATGIHPETQPTVYQQGKK